MNTAKIKEKQQVICGTITEMNQVIAFQLYVPVATLLKENDKKLLEQFKLGFKRTVKWNKYRKQMATWSNNKNLNDLIDPTFTKANRLFVLSFEIFAREDNTTKDLRGSLSHYYVPNVEIKILMF